jgi:hypothetical protein
MPLIAAHTCRAAETGAGGRATGAAPMSIRPGRAGTGCVAPLGQLHQIAQTNVFG